MLGISLDEMMPQGCLFDVKLGHTQYLSLSTNVYILHGPIRIKASVRMGT